MGEADKRGKEERKKEDVWSRRKKAVRANTVNNADTGRDRVTPVQDIDMYACMYVCMCMYVCRYVDVCMYVCIDRYIDR